MTTESSTAAAVTAGTVRLANGRTANARRTAVAGAAPVVRFADSAGRARSASDDVAATFTPITVEAVEQAHGVALIEAAGHGVRILTQITVDQHDAAFAGAPWPVTGPAQLTGQSDTIRVAIAGQWYQLTRVQMPSGERRRFARQYNGHGDGPKDVREASMLFGCAWSSVPVVGWTEAEIEAAHEAAAEADDYADRVDILPEHEQELINAAADELRRIADDADREAAEQLAELGGWGHSPADILAEQDVDTSGCSNPWHRSAGLYSRRACPECPAPARAVESVVLPALIEAHQLNDKVDAVASVGLPLSHGAVADALIAAVRPALAGVRPAEAKPFEVGQAVEVDTRYLTTEPEQWERATVYAVGGLLGGQNIEVEYAVGGVAAVSVARVRAVTGCQHPGELGRIACGWGHCRACGSALRTANGRTPELDPQGRFMYAENGDQSGARTPDPPHSAGAGPAVTTDRTDPQT